MSNEVTIKTDAGTIQTSPQDLLEHFLPGARPYKDSDRIFEGHVPGQPNKPCYVQKEALMGMLMECKEKRLNPISSMYLIPSTSPDRPAGHKIKYSEGVQRARLISGFLGMNQGLIVQRGKDVIDTHGDMALAGDKILGAWAELYINNLPRPLRKEIAAKEFWGSGPQWDKKGGFMLCKVALDHLLRMNFPTLYSQPEDGELVLEADADLSIEATATAGEDPSESPQLINRQQQVRLFAIAKEHGVSHNDLKWFLSEAYGLDSTTDIRRVDYETICEEIEDGSVSIWAEKERQFDNETVTSATTAQDIEQTVDAELADDQHPEPGSEG